MLWLEAFLQSGPKLCYEITLASREFGFGKDTLRMARKILGVVSYYEEDQKNKYMWALPKDKEREPSEKEAAHRILKNIRSRPFDPSRPPVTQTQIVEWVSEYRMDKVYNIPPESVPNARALDLLLWAKKNPDDFRRLYDCRLIERPVPAAAGSKKGPNIGHTADTQRARQEQEIDKLLKKAGKG